MADNKKPGKNPAAVALGRLGGLRGVPARIDRDLFEKPWWGD